MRLMRRPLLLPWLLGLALIVVGPTLAAETPAAKSPPAPAAAKARTPKGPGPKGPAAKGGGEKGKGGQGEETPMHIIANSLEVDRVKNVVIFSGAVKATQGDSILYCDQLRIYYTASPPEGTPAEGQSAPGAGGAPGAKGGAPAAEAKSTASKPAGSTGPPAGGAPAAKGSAPGAAKPSGAEGGKAAKASPLGEMGGEKITRIEAEGHVRLVQEDKVATGNLAIYYKDREEIVLTGNPRLWQGENTLQGERIIYNLNEDKVWAESSTKKRVEAHLYPGGKPAAEKGKAPAPARPGRKGVNR
jgi:lipopolysaccharide export system protein LptA